MSKTNYEVFKDDPDALAVALVHAYSTGYTEADRGGYDRGLTYYAALGWLHSEYGSPFPTFDNPTPFDRTETVSDPDE